MVGEATSPSVESSAHRPSPSGKETSITKSIPATDKAKEGTASTTEETIETVQTGDPSEVISRLTKENARLQEQYQEERRKSMVMELASQETQRQQKSEIDRLNSEIMRLKAENARLQQAAAPQTGAESPKGASTGNNSIDTDKIGRMPLAPTTATTTAAATKKSGTKSHQQLWMERFQELREFKANHKHCNVPRSRYPTLEAWTRRQRKRQSSGVLSKQEENKLKSIGFQFDDFESSFELWNTRFKELEDYQKEHGHCNVPQSRKPKEGVPDGLGKWVSLQRKRKEHRSLGKEQEEKLKSIGFDFSDTPATATWLDRFLELEQFVKENGHFNILDKAKKQPELKRLDYWVRGQQERKKAGKLRSGEEERLRSIGFPFDVGSRNEQRWEKRYEELRQFKIKHGHCNVSDGNRKNDNNRDASKELGYWVGHQRGAHNKGKLSKKRKERLDELGFFWSDCSSAEGAGCKTLLDHKAKELWKKRFEQLIEYKAEHGHCRVPQSYPKLGEWCIHQRTRKLKPSGKTRCRPMTDEEEKKLNAVGFIWDPKNTPRKKPRVEQKELETRTREQHGPDPRLHWDFII